MKAGSPSLEHWLPVQHPKGGHRPFGSPPHSPLTVKPKPASQGNAILRGWWKEEQQGGSGHLSLSTWPAAGGYSGSRQKKEEAGQTESAATRSLGLEGTRLVHAAEELTEQSTARTGWGDGKEGERVTPALHHCLELETGGAVLLFTGRRKMGFRGAYLNSSAKATGTETPAGENAQG